MELRKAYMAPFWNMVALVVLFVASNIYTYLFFYKTFLPYISFFTVFKPHLIELLILIAEAVIYWFIRNWKIRKLLIWVHIGSLYFIILGVSLVLLLLALLLFDESLSDAKVDNWMSNARTMMNIFFFVAGHIFFAAGIIDGYKNKKKLDNALLEESL